MGKPVSWGVFLWQVHAIVRLSLLPPGDDRQDHPCSAEMGPMSSGLQGSNLPTLGGFSRF